MKTAIGTLAIGTAFFAVTMFQAPAIAHSQSAHHQGQQSVEKTTPGSGRTANAMPHSGGGSMMPDMSMHSMMARMMAMHPEMVSMMQGMHERMGSGMMRPMMDGRSGPAMMRGQAMMGLDVGVVRPIQHLSVEDVRHYFEHRLEQLGNPHLKLGEVKVGENDSVITEIVTVDGSLVERLSVNQHSGKITRRK